MHTSSISAVVEKTGSGGRMHVVHIILCRLVGIRVIRLVGGGLGARKVEMGGAFRKIEGN